MERYTFWLPYIKKTLHLKIIYSLTKNYNFLQQLTDQKSAGGYQKQLIGGVKHKDNKSTVYHQNFLQNSLGILF